MNKQKFIQYWNLTARLVNSSNVATRKEVYTENSELIDREFVRVMKVAVKQLEKNKKHRRAKWLIDLATQLETKIITWEKLNKQIAKLHQKNEYHQALQFAQKALVLAKSIWQNDSLKVANSIKNVGLLLEAQAKLEEAEPYYRDTLAMKHKLYYGLDNEDLAKSFYDLGTLLEHQGKTTEAESYYREALAIKSRLSQRADRSIEHYDLPKSERQYSRDDL